MSLRKAIDDMCKACIYDPNAAGNWRQQTTICTSFDCPLYPVRPVSSSPIPKSVLDDYGLKMDVFPAHCGFTLAEGRLSGEVAYWESKKGLNGPSVGANK